VGNYFPPLRDYQNIMIMVGNFLVVELIITSAIVKPAIIVLALACTIEIPIISRITSKNII